MCVGVLAFHFPLQRLACVGSVGEKDREIVEKEKDQKSAVIFFGESRNLAQLLYKQFCVFLTTGYISHTCSHDTGNFLDSIL